MSKKKMAAVIALSALTALTPMRAGASSSFNPSTRPPATAGVRGSQTAPVESAIQAELKKQSPLIWESVIQKWPALKLSSKPPRFTFKSLGPAEVDTLESQSDQPVIADKLYVIEASDAAVVLGYLAGKPPTLDEAKQAIAYCAISIALEKGKPMSNAFFKVDYLPDFLTRPHDSLTSNSDDFCIALTLDAVGGSNQLFGLAQEGREDLIAERIDRLISPGTYDAIKEAPFEGQSPTAVLAQQMAQSEHFKKIWKAIQAYARSQGVDASKVVISSQDGKEQTLGDMLSDTF